MLRKRFHIGKSETKSRIFFALPETEPHRNLKRSMFRDPAAIPILRNIAQSLKVRGYKVTGPKPGKACHGFCKVSFPDVEISIVMLVRRRKGNIEFQIMTWPSQTLRQRISGRAMRSPDCPEWAELCATVHTVLAENPRLKSLALHTFAKAEAEVNW